MTRISLHDDALAFAFALARAADSANRRADAVRWSAMFDQYIAAFRQPCLMAG